MSDNRELENIYSIKYGHTAVVGLLCRDTYIGEVSLIDYCDGTITLVDGFVYEITVEGKIQKYFNKVTIHEDDVLFCIDKSPIIVYVPMDKEGDN